MVWTGRTLRALLLGGIALAIAASCGGVASQPGEDGSGGDAGTGGASNAGSGGSVATAGKGGGGGSGGRATGGTTGVAGSGSGAVVGAGGFSVDAGSMGPQVGVGCEGVVCLPGQACILCVLEGASTSERLCVPHPIDDPMGYASATTACRTTTVFNDCDGPEDCAAGEYCVAREGVDGFQRCRSMPSTELSCCFSCGALTDCTLCNTTEDCPDGEVCEPATSELMGCRRPLPDQ
jgi:hypothetical protein